MRRGAAVGVDDDLAPRQARVSHRPADHELPGRVDVEEVAVAEAALVVEIVRQDRAQNVVDQVGLDQRLGVEAVAVLGRDQHPLDLDGALAAVLVDLVAHRDLRLAVGAQIRQHVGLANLRQAVRDPMRELDRQRHQLGRLVRGVAEHHPLVACSDAVDRVAVAVLSLERLVDALRDVGRLLVQRHDDAASVGVEPVLGARVADAGHRLAHEPWNVDVRGGRDLPGHDDEAGRDQGLARDPAHGVVREDGVENGIGDLVGDLVRMPLGDRLRAEAERAGAHGRKSSRVIRRSGRAPSASPRGDREARRRARCRPLR